VAHAAGKVSVGRAEANFAFAQNAHVAAASAVTGVITHPGEVLKEMPVGIR
jgi:hypothetical protein